MAPLRGLIAAGLTAFLVTGCLADIAGGVTGAVLDKAFGDGSTSIEATIEASQDINPDYEGNPSPLVVRLYELKSPTAFNNAGFFALYDSDAAELGDDMQGREEWDFAPGDKVTIERDLQPETRWVGVMGAYRDIENTAWRAVAEMDEGSSNDVIIALGRTGISIEVD